MLASGVHLVDWADVGHDRAQRVGFGGDQEAMITAAVSASVWLSWVVNLLIAEWWLQCGRAARHRPKLQPLSR
ncbi:MAG: hypothetical protein ACRDST_14825 [Pseudonocardiaceae bacterium]